MSNSNSNEDFLKIENDNLKIHNKFLEEKILELENKLKSYTNNTSHKKYYNKNSDIVKERSKEYMKKIKETNPEKIKEWRHQAYLNRKAKLNLNNNI